MGLVSPHMFRWCSFCYTYLGEKKPFESFELTHGICSVCKTQILNNKISEEEIFERTEKIKGLILFTQNKYSKQDRLSALEFLRRGQELKIPLTDLVMGLIVPSLYKVGELWSTSQLTVAQEHSYKSYCSEILQNISSFFAEYQSYRNSLAPEVLLITSKNNNHLFGTEIVELFLMINQIPSMVTPSSMAYEEIVDLVKKVKPKAIGISISLAPQMNTLHELISALKKEHCFPNIVLGGFYIREVNFPELSLSCDYPQLNKFNEISDFINFLKKASRYSF